MCEKVKYLLECYIIVFALKIILSVVLYLFGYTGWYSRRQQNSIRKFIKWCSKLLL